MFLQKSFYKKPQKYEASFRITLKNLSKKDNFVSAILPFPLETPYQEILGKTKISPKTGKIKKESKMQNRFVFWEEKLKSKEEKVFMLSFNVLVKPRTKPLKSGTDKSNKKFLKSDEFVNVNKKIVKISETVVRNLVDEEEKVKALNDFVINNLEYGDPIEGLYSSNDALKKEKVDCGGFDTLLAVLCIAQKVPARLVSGFFAGFGPNQMHAWLEIFVSGKGWIVADPSIEKLSKEGRTRKKAALGNIPPDRVALSVGQDFNLNLAGKNIKLVILQNPFVVAQNGENSIKVESEFKAHKI